MHLKCTCGARLKVPEDAAGKKVRCPACGALLAPAPATAGVVRKTDSWADAEAPDPEIRDERGYAHVVHAAFASSAALYALDAPENCWHAFMGGAVPFIPDFTMGAASEADRRQMAVEVLNRQISFIQTLAPHKQASFALRFITRAEEPRIDLALFAKCSAASADAAEAEARRVWSAVGNTFPSGYPLETFTRAGAFLDAFQPFAFNDVAEIRRPESALPQGAYVVYPFAWGLNAMVHLCTALVRARADLVASVLLRPTVLPDAERAAINWMASRLREAADQMFSGFSGQQHIVDESARLAADLYTSMLRELSEPILMKVHLAGAQPVPEALVAALGTEITRPSESVVTDHEQQSVAERHLSHYYDVARPAHEGERLIARRELYLMESYPWGGTHAPQELARLRYLVDSRQANCAFRLPVAPADRIDGIVVRPYSPFSRSYRRVEPDVPAIRLGRFVHRGVKQEDGPSLPVAQLARHALVAGFTGSGKTTTCMYLLAELWTRHRIPWLVLEPAKTEYRQLCLRRDFGADVRVFSLGNEDCSPFRLNPLEPVPGYPLQAHVDYLRSAFFASLALWEPLPRILERCLHEVFRGRPWDPERGMDDPPTLADLAALIEPVVRQLGYDAQIRDRAIGALRARLESLLLGNKGRMLSGKRGIPIDVLLDRPTILELRWITDPEERALLLALLLIRLYEHRVAESSRRGGGPAPKLRHVTLFEEAHQLLSAAPAGVRNAEESSAAQRSTGVFADMLSEIRAFGEGLIIADQIPGKLVADVVKNTDLKIAHTLRAPDDRAMMAHAMNLNAQQEAYVGILPVGHAALHYEGLEDATLVEFPNFKEEGAPLGDAGDAAVAAHMAAFHEEHAGIFEREGQCPACEDEERCPFRAAVEAALENKALLQEMLAAALPTLAGGDQRRRLLFLASDRLRRLARVRVERENLAEYLRCCCVQVGRRALARNAEDAGLGAREVAGHLRSFVACHEPLITRAEDRPELLAEVHRAFEELCRPMFLPSPGCDLCRKQCMFYHHVQPALQDAAARAAASQALRERDAWSRFPRACLDAVAPVVGTDPSIARHAAYCFAVQLFESHGLSGADKFELVARSLKLKPEGEGT